MDERTLLKRLSKGSQQALETVIMKYSAYVVAVIHNRSRGRETLRTKLCQGGFLYESEH